MQFSEHDLSDLEFDRSRDQEVLEMMRKIYPVLNEQQLIEAKENLERYLKLAWKIAERIVQESVNTSFDKPSNYSYDTQQRSKIDNSSLNESENL